MARDAFPRDPFGGATGAGLARAAAQLGVRIFEHSAVTRIAPGAPATLRTTNGEVRAAHVLLAGNVYLQDLVDELASRIMPVGTYIIASQDLGATLARSLIPSQSAVCDSNFVLDYFRPTPDHRLLFGGRVSYSAATPANLADGMKHRMVLTFPQLREIVHDPLERLQIFRRFWPEISDQI